MDADEDCPNRWLAPGGAGCARRAGAGANEALRAAEVAGGESGGTSVTSSSVKQRLGWSAMKGLKRHRVPIFSLHMSMLSSTRQIWVYEPGVQDTVVWTMVSLTAVAIALLLWGAYFAYWKTHGKRFS